MTTPEPELIRRGEPDRAAYLRHLDLLAALLDRAFRIPGTPWRFGLDAVIGLIPGLGDIVGSLVGAYSLWIARQMGAPAAVQARMVMNLAIDGVIGLVPFLGDLFDFAFKAHTRNHALLTRWVATPHQTRRSSWMVLAAGVVVLVAVLAGAVWVFIAALRWLAALF
jgi:uncharacterized membrane protein